MGPFQKYPMYLGIRILNVIQYLIHGEHLVFHDQHLIFNLTQFLLMLSLGVKEKTQKSENKRECSDNYSGNEPCNPKYIGLACKLKLLQTEGFVDYIRIFQISSKTSALKNTKFAIRFTFALFEYYKSN
ncbi:MAG: hypothetical protein IPO78_16995 [Saprospiraceae bacterium]|nr:hypothetical protein [Saprospiraceae bacterium]